MPTCSYRYRVVEGTLYGPSLSASSLPSPPPSLRSASPPHPRTVWELMNPLKAIGIDPLPEHWSTRKDEHGNKVYCNSVSLPLAVFTEAMAARN